MAREHYRSDGVRITHDPYAPGMVEMYGRPGETDAEGFDPYADSVGPGIYGGIVRRDPATGEIVIGKQYQNHNPRPGPVYAGGGYTPMSNALRKGEAALKPLLDKHPQLVDDVSTGGARPLHMCGMGRENQNSTAFLIARGADIEALDTYGMTPLHRMASNNLARGAEALLTAKADPNNAGKCGATPMQIAQESRARDVVQLLKRYGGSTKASPPKSSAQHASRGRPQASSVLVRGSGVREVEGEYEERDPGSVPEGFGRTCAQMGWDTKKMWLKLSNQQTPWFEAPNGSYIYWNRSDGQWWIDAPDGGGIYVAMALGTTPPADGWKALNKSSNPVPSVEFHAAESAIGA